MRSPPLSGYWQQNRPQNATEEEDVEFTNRLIENGDNAIALARLQGEPKGKRPDKGKGKGKGNGGGKGFSGSSSSSSKGGSFTLGKGCFKSKHTPADWQEL